MKRIFLLAFVAFVSLLFFSCRPDNSDRIHPDDYFDYASWIEENKGKNGDIVFLGDSRMRSSFHYILSFTFSPATPESHISKLLKEMKGRTFIRLKGVH